MINTQSKVEDLIYWLLPFYVWFIIQSHVFYKSYVLSRNNLWCLSVEYINLKKKNVSFAKFWKSYKISLRLIIVPWKLFFIQLKHFFLLIWKKQQTCALSMQNQSKRFDEITENTFQENRILRGLFFVSKSFPKFYLK